MNYSYDVFGNLTQNEQGNPITVNPATNQVSCTPSCYDLNGNMTSGANATMTYDSTNRMVSAVVSGGGAGYYDYAPDGKRIYRESVNGAQSTDYWMFYGARGEKLGVFSFGLVYNQGLGTYQFTALMSDNQFAGKTIVNNGATMMQDRLGTRAGIGLCVGEQLGELPREFPSDDSGVCKRPDKQSESYVQLKP